MATDLNTPILPAGRVLPIVRRSPQEERDARQRQPRITPQGSPGSVADEPDTTAADEDSQTGGVIDDYV